MTNEIPMTKRLIRTAHPATNNHGMIEATQSPVTEAVIRFTAILLHHPGRHKDCSPISESSDRFRSGIGYCNRPPHSQRHAGRRCPLHLRLQLSAGYQRPDHPEWREPMDPLEVVRHLHTTGAL